MARANYLPLTGRPDVVGSFGSRLDLTQANIAQLTDACDLVEIRLDLLKASGTEVAPSDWCHLRDFPLLFTARRREEGGALTIHADERNELLKKSLNDAAIVDVEVASIDEMSEILSEIRDRRILWIASFHDFNKLPDTKRLVEAAEKAKAAGATIFKVAAVVSSPADVARLAEFQLGDHGILISSMGMGPLAPVSRLLCAQSGSVLNYGYHGSTPTAPGQWDCAFLKQAISRLAIT